MEFKLNIPFEQLMQLIKQLPEIQLSELRKIISEPKTVSANQDFKQNDFQEFLLKGPVFTAKQLKEIDETRSRINQWRKK